MSALEIFSSQACFPSMNRRRTLPNKKSRIFTVFKSVFHILSVYSGYFHEGDAKHLRLSPRGVSATSSWERDIELWNDEDI